MTIPIFQYNTDTIGPFDAITLNAYIRRAWSYYSKPNSYVMGKSPDPSLDASDGMSFDCSGLCWASTYRKRLGTMSEKYWVRIPNPIAGACLRHDPSPGEEYGHAGVIVRVHADGDYDTLDASASYGAIKYRERAGKSFWNKQRNVRFLVSNEALLQGAPLNLLLAVYRQPQKTAILGASVFLLAAAISAFIVIKGRK